jgi:Zn-dependent protease with chaperone function
MNAGGLVAFNLLFNAVPAFLLALVFARGTVCVFRPRPGLTHVLLSALPFLKLVVELLRGVPSHSFLWLRIHGVTPDLGSLHVGVGLSWLVPRLQLALGALSRDLHYTQSGGDFVAAILTELIAPWVPAVVVVAVLSVSTLRLARRGAAWVRASLERRRIFRSSELAQMHLVGARRIPILISAECSGSPFMAGLFSPYVVIPRRTWECLMPNERQAAIAHEVAHIGEQHLLITTSVGLVRDVFWFVPFVRIAERAVHEACELAADANAIRQGVAPALIASALVRAGESMATNSASRPVTLGADGASLRVRLAQLLDGASRPRLGFQRAVPRVALTAWVTATVLIAVVFGNH